MVTGKDSMEISKFDIQVMLCKVHRTLNDFLGLKFKLYFISGCE